MSVLEAMEVKEGGGRVELRLLQFVGGGGRLGRRTGDGGTAVIK